MTTTSLRLLVAALLVSSLPLFGQAAPAASSATETAIAAARQALRNAEAAHPGKSAEVAAALHELISSEFDAQQISEATLEEARRETDAAEAAAGEQSEALVVALVDQATALDYLSRQADARPLAERAYSIAEKNFPDARCFSSAADELASLLNTMGEPDAAIKIDDASIASERRAGAGRELDLATSLSARAEIEDLKEQYANGGRDLEEAVVVAARGKLDDLNLGSLESNVGTHYSRSQEFAKAIPHFERATELIRQAQGPDSPLLMAIQGNLADLYSRTGQFAASWKGFETALTNKNESLDSLAWTRFGYARSLASGGSLTQAIDQGLEAEQQSRARFVLQARTLPERQALDYERRRPYGLNIALSVLADHPEIDAAKTFQEAMRSRNLVADEMARRQINLNASNNPEIARELEELARERAALLKAEESQAPGRAAAIAAAASNMEKTERLLAEQSAALRNDEQQAAVRLEDVRRGIPAGAVLVSYVAYRRAAVDKADPTHKMTWSYLAFVLHPGSGPIRVFDLGEAKPIEDLVGKLRASAASEAQSGGQGSTRNERSYRESGTELRRRIWDPLKKEIADANLVLVVPDGMLSIVPLASLPATKGYLVDENPVIHLLTSERDLLAAEETEKKTGLLAVGGPAFGMEVASSRTGTLRDAGATCEQFKKMEFPALPGASLEATAITSDWRRWGRGENVSLLTGQQATLDRFLHEAEIHRVLHIATHAFLLDNSCGDSNPLLHSGLVFAGANRDRSNAILTAQQIASLDLTGVDWAVLSACNTGTGELRSGEGVLGLERAFRVAGARSVVMSLWQVSDEDTRRFMELLYEQRLERRRSTADAVWKAERQLLAERRSMGRSTHPWYWAGFVAAGDWR